MSATFRPCRLINNCWTPAPGLEGLNVSNSNASSILANLGLDPDFENAAPCPLEQFEAECATFLRIAAGGDADGAIAEQSERGAGGATMIHCGRREGYLSDRVATLIALAREGLRHGCTHMLCA